MSSGGGGAKDAQEKRPRGRPSKTGKPPTLEHRGILTAPDDPDARFECASDQPVVFKKMFTYFKNIAADVLYFMCTGRGITIVTRDAHRKVRVVTEIPGSAGGAGLINSYWCSRPGMLFSVKRKEVADVFNSIDKTFWKISMVVRHDIPKELTVTFKDHAIGKECVNRIEVTRYQKIPEKDRDLFDARALVRREALEAASISFRLTSKQFKKTIGDAVRRSAGQLIIEKLGSHPMQIIDKSSTSGGESAYNEVYRDGDLIQLVSTIEPDEVMRCSFEVFTVKSLATAMVTENIDLFCFNDESSDNLVLVSPVHEAAAEEADDAAPAAPAGTAHRAAGVYIASVVRTPPGCDDR